MKLFIQGNVKFLTYTLRPRLRYLKGPPRRLALCASQKNYGRNRRTNPII
eukprot:UN27442